MEHRVRNFLVKSRKLVPLVNTRLQRISIACSWIFSEGFEPRTDTQRLFRETRMTPRKLPEVPLRRGRSPHDGRHILGAEMTRFQVSLQESDHRLQHLACKPRGLRPNYEDTRRSQRENFAGRL